MSKSQITALILGSILLLAISACNDDDDPSCPGIQPPTPTMSNIWPHADGNTWIYDLVFQEFDMPAAETNKDAEPIPSMEDLHADLQQSPSGEPTMTETGLYRLALDGEVTTQSGVTAQKFQETLYCDASSQNGGKSRTIQPSTDPLLQIIAQVRPDLRPALAPYLDLAAKDFQDVSVPLFLSGYTFAAEDTGYYGYGDLNTIHSWTYLDNSLDVGTEFVLQLLPGFADDLWLHGKIWSQGDLTVAGQTFENVVECMYLIDLGESSMVDEEGNFIGYFHSYTYGTIHYAAEVGPIKSLERMHLAPSSFEGGGDPYIRDYVVNLAGVLQAE